MAQRAKTQDELIASLQSQLDVAHAKNAAHCATIDAHCSTIATHCAQLDEQAREITRRNARIELLEEQLAALKRRMFGQHSEKLSPDQLALWRAEQQEQVAAIEAELAQLAEPIAPPVESITEVTKRHPKRPVELPANLPRKTTTLDVEAICSCCGGQLHRIGEERTQSLEWIPGHFEAHNILRPKYACRTCETVITAALPPRVNAKCLLGGKCGGSGAGVEVCRSSAAASPTEDLSPARCRHS